MPLKFDSVKLKGHPIFYRVNIIFITVINNID